MKIVFEASKLPFPTLVICPKTADAVHLDVLLDDIHKRIDGIDNKKAVELLAFAIAGAGFRNFDIGTYRRIIVLYSYFSISSSRPSKEKYAYRGDIGAE